MDPATRAVIQAGAAAAAAEGERWFAEPPAAKDGPLAEGAGDPVTEVGTFRAEFQELVAGLDQVTAIVVFIDDLDRCLPETVVDTFEAIRLFLNTPKTAYVVAANQQVVELAIDSRYPELRRQDGTGVGADYLEKMLQLKVAIPTLSAPEAETYMNLLLAELRLGGESLEKVRAAVRKRRAENSLMVAFNLGVAGDILGDVPPELARDLEWAARIAPVLGAGLRGNPRQLKRFLNNLLLKTRAAARREVELDLEVLAKLMVLEDQHVGDFQRLFDWQLTAAGPIPELAAAEAAVQPELRTEGPDAAGEQPKAEPAAREDGPARGRRPTGTGKAAAAAESRPKRRPAGPALADEVAAWVAKPHVRDWLALPPRLGKIDLRPYFTYSRDKLSLGVVASRLPPQLQELLLQVEAEVDPVRRAALDRVKELDATDRGQLVDELLDRLLRYPAGPAFVAAVELVERVPETAAAVCEAMTKIPPTAVPPERALTVVRRLPVGDPAVEGLLDGWQASGVAALEQITTTARQARQAAARNTRPRPS
jgi:KAP family P-loop domain